MNDLTTFGVNKSVADLRREDIERQALELAARALENKEGINEMYQKAWRAAAKFVRSLKP